MTDTPFDKEFVRFLAKYSDEAYLGIGFHMDAAGWIAWIRHVGELGGKPVSALEALRRFERILDKPLANPFRPVIRRQWEDRLIDIKNDRVKGLPFQKKCAEALTRLRELFAG